MQKKEFKLLIEGFNKYLLNEHMEYTQKRRDLIAEVPQEFSEFINDKLDWLDGVAAMSGTDYEGDYEDDKKLLFEAVAKACGCKVEDLLVHYADNFREECDDFGCDGQVFLNSYQRTKNRLCGSFNIEGASLMGYYYRLGVDCGLEEQFKDMMSSRKLKGLIFVAPDKNLLGRYKNKQSDLKKNSINNA